MILKMQKRIAAKVLGVGYHKVWMNPLRLTEIKEAITKQDIMDLIKDGAIKSREFTGRKTNVRRKRKGSGSRKGRVMRSKRDYMMKIRKLRRFLKLIKENSLLSVPEIKKLRLLSKSGHFKSQRHLKEHITHVMKKDISSLEKKENGKK
jgi:large subunit ribosomal protein L19e